MIEHTDKTYSSSRREKALHRLFDLGVWLKGIDGVLETAGGVLFLFAARITLNRIVAFITQHELVEDPHDWIATALRHAVRHLSADTKLFGGVYLIGHGLVKVFLAVELLRGRLWSYPAALAFLCVFIGYQIYRMTYRFSPGLLILTCVDFVVVLLIRHEYAYAKRQRT